MDGIGNHICGMCQTHGCLIREGPWFLQVLSLFKADLIKQTGVAWSGVANILNVAKIQFTHIAFVARILGTNGTGSNDIFFHPMVEK